MRGAAQRRTLALKFNGATAKRGVEKQQGEAARGAAQRSGDVGVLGEGSKGFNLGRVK